MYEILQIPWEGQQSLLEGPEIFGKISVEIPPDPNIQGILEEIPGWDEAVEAFHLFLNSEWVTRIVGDMLIQQETEHALSSIDHTVHSQRSAEDSERKTGNTPTTE